MVKFILNLQWSVIKPLNIIGNSTKIQEEYFTGTKITFLLTTEIFKNIEFNFKIIEKRLRELAFLNTGVNINLDKENR